MRFLRPVVRSALSLLLLAACGDGAGPSEAFLDPDAARTARDLDDDSADAGTDPLDTASDSDEDTARDAGDDGLDAIDGAERSDGDEVGADSDGDDRAGEPDVSAECGNGLFEGAEHCDDGNDSADDGCDRCSLTGDGLYLQLRGVPDTAERYFIAIDGGDLPEPAVLVRPVAAAPVDVLRLPLAPGGPYRVRVLAVVGTRFPSVVTGAVARDLVVDASARLGTTVDMSAVAVRRDVASPDGALVGEVFNLGVFVDDAFEALPAHSRGRVWVAEEDLGDLNGTQEYADRTSLGGTRSRYDVELVAGNPNQARTLFIQFGESAADFAHAGEVPFIVLPSTRLGHDQWTVEVRRADSGIDLTVTDVPDEADMVYVTVDGGKLSGPLRFEAVPETGVAEFEIGLIGGEGYRIRVVATTGGGVFPVVLAGGRNDDVSIPIRPRVEMSLPALPFGFTSAAPATVAVGEEATVSMSIETPPTSSSPPLRAACIGIGRYSTAT